MFSRRLFLRKKFSSKNYTAKATSRFSLSLVLFAPNHLLVRKLSHLKDRRGRHLSNITHVSFSHFGASTGKSAHLYGQIIVHLVIASHLYVQVRLIPKFIPSQLYVQVRLISTCKFVSSPRSSRLISTCKLVSCLRASPPISPSNFDHISIHQFASSPPPHLLHHFNRNFTTSSEF